MISNKKPERICDRCHEPFGRYGKVKTNVCPACGKVQGEKR